MDNPEEEVTTEPYWVDEPKCSSYISTIGLILGYVAPGNGPASQLWFGFLAKADDAPISIGVTDRQEAKKSVETALQMSWDLVVEASKQKGKRR